MMLLCMYHAGSKLHNLFVSTLSIPESTAVCFPCLEKKIRVLRRIEDD